MNRTELCRFFSKVRVDPITGCWRWLGSKTSAGYGQVTRKQRTTTAHRWSYLLFVGPLSDDQEPDHLCRQRDCVAPFHLESVTHRENMLRGNTFAAQNAAKTHCPQGHPYTPENTYWSKEGWRSCRICAKEESRNYRLSPAGKETRQRRAEQTAEQISTRRKNRNSRTHCPRGHEYTEQNTKWMTGKGYTFRVCLICLRETRRKASQKYRAKKLSGQT